MKRWQIISAALAALAALSGSYAAGQGAAKTAARDAAAARKTRHVKLLERSEAGAYLFDKSPAEAPSYKSALNDLSGAYRKSAGDAELTRAVQEDAALLFLRIKYGPKSSASSSSSAPASLFQSASAEEASLKLRLLETAQNQKIIELLQQIAAKK